MKTIHEQAAGPMGRHRMGGWNLIELMVVISIITVLLAILINTAVENNAPIQLTKATLRGAMAAAVEYEVSTTTKVDHFAGPTGSGGSSISRFCYALWKLDKTRNMLRSLGKDAIAGDTSTVPLAINDAWGNPLRYYSGTGANIHDETGANKTLLEAGMIASKDAYLASAGPDGKWGTVDAFNVRSNEAKDNLYSNDLE